MSLNINIHPGRLPEFWKRSIIFFANLDSVFFGNTGQLQALENEVEGIETYGGRLMSVLSLLFNSRPNLLVLEKNPNPILVNYFQEKLKLSLPEVLVFDPEVYSSINKENLYSSLEEKRSELINMLKKYPCKWIDGFVADNSLELWAEATGKTSLNKLKGSHEANNKLDLYYFLLEKGLPVVDTEVVATTGHIEECLDNLYQKGFKKGVLKSQIGASGIGIIPLNIPSNNHNVPDYMFYEGPCLLQGWLSPGYNNIRKIYSPSVQLFIDQDSISLFDITEQILSDESVHEGNIAIPDYIKNNSELQDEILRQAEIASIWLYERPYRGPGSVDFLVVERENKFEVYICEVNARFTGATYPSVLSRHFISNGSWILKNIDLTDQVKADELLELVEQKELLFLPEKSEGLIPVNFNLDDNGYVIKGQFLYIAENTKLCIEGMDRSISVLPVEN